MDVASQHANAHESITSAACRLNVESSSFVGTVSRHVLPDTISFKTLASLHSAAKDACKTSQPLDVIATSGSDLIFSVKLSPTLDRESGGVRSKSGKRKRDLADNHCLQVQTCIKKLNVGSGSVSQSEVDIAEAVLTRIVRDMRGPNGEMLVESFGVFVRKLGDQDGRASLVLAVRINSGLAVPIGQLKHALGSCWQDGVVSSQSSVMGIQQEDLPLTDEGNASLSQGNRPLLVVTSVPRSASDGT